MAVPMDPAAFVPGAADETTALLGDLLYDPLYRLDTTLTPRPALAAALPAVSADGLTWSIDLVKGARFHDGSRVTSADVVASLQLAASPSCPFARDLCESVSAHLAGAAAEGAERVTIALRDPWAPFLAEALGRVPVVSTAALGTAADSLVAAARDVDAAALRSRVERITEETNAERCLVAAPPSGCRLADYVAELSATLGDAGAAVPPPARFTSADGSVDGEAHGAALLQSVGSLATVLMSEGIDRLAAATPLVDIVEHPLGGGPFRLESYDPGVAVGLRRHPGHVPQAGLSGITLRIVRDPSVAATAIRAGDVDWMLELPADQA
ncbi:MAG: hypothetical protein H0V04_01230, partial [Chloroflexi bacterium]|nr:hypothetical protein [Chloroflexota bacterium]